MDLEAVLPRSLVNARVRMGSVGSTLPGGTMLTPWMSATPEAILYDFPGLRMLVRGTDEVVVDLDDPDDTAQVGPMLYGAAVRALLLHAGVFTLHATVVRHGDTVVAIAGHSGAGKSTTATALCHRHGAALLVDDVVPTRVVDGRPHVHAFDRPVHLTLDAAERLGLNIADAEVVDPGSRGKVALPAARFGGASGSGGVARGGNGGGGDPSGEGGAGGVELHRLVVLSLAENSANRGTDADAGAAPARDLTRREVSGAERLRQIVRLSNATGVASFGDRGAAYFEWATAVADALPITEVVRVEDADTLDEVCGIVLSSGRERTLLP